MMRTLKIAALVSLLALVSCKGAVQPEPQPAVITDSEHCGPACVHLMDLGCEEGFPIPVALQDGGTRMAPCSEMCINTQSKGVWLNPVCVEKISKCDQIENCAISSGKK